MKKERGRGSDYIQKRTGNTFQYFSNNISQNITFNSNTPVQAKINRLSLLGCSEILPYLQNQRCTIALLTPN